MVETALKKQSISANIPYYVAIGASAGGLEAICEFLDHLNPDLHFAYFYIQHLSPDHKSVLPEILSKHTTMEVLIAKQGHLIKPNHVYVIPPGKKLCIEGDQLKLLPRGSELTIDVFFKSLAKAKGQRAVSIVLSGSASDGAQGVEAIVKAGGWAFAQDETAEFNSMPDAAIATGKVNFIASPKEMPAILERLGLNKNVSSSQSPIHSGKSIQSEVLEILKLINKKKNVDFSGYKMNTIVRRIERRMSENKVKNLVDFLQVLKTKPFEIDLLYQDLLISVTSFFRDPEAYAYLEKVLFPKIISGKEPGEMLRIWVPGCASGEEVYSTAMLLMELQAKSSKHFKFQIFGTDLNSKAIIAARAGVFTEKQIEGIPGNLLASYFTQTAGRYKVSASLRDVCVFSEHNILRDPSFSKMDLISCCNMLIYFGSTAQRQVMSSFHFGLQENGYLLLGKSESVGHATNLFKLLHPKVKVYCRKKGKEKDEPYILNTSLQDTIIQTRDNKMEIMQGKAKVNDLSSAFDLELLEKHVPGSTIINSRLDIIHFRGETEPFFKFSGKASFNILKIVDPQFSFELRNAIQEVLKTNRTVTKRQIEYKSKSGSRYFLLEVSPFEVKSQEKMMMVLFKEQEILEHSSSESTSSDHRVKKLEEELFATRSEIQSLLQNQEAAIEELQSANEEIVSSNEELRTVNEELETSKEEIEATNEELISSNRELQLRNDEIEELSNYSAAILATIPDSLITLNKKLIVQSANDQFYSTFRISEASVLNKPFLEISQKQWDNVEVKKLLKNVLKEKNVGETIEFSMGVKEMGEKHLAISARRILQKSSNDERILLIIEDRTLEKQKEKQIKVKEEEILATRIEAKARLSAQQEANDYLKDVFMNAPVAISIFKGKDHEFDLVNDMSRKLIGGRDVTGQKVSEAFPELVEQGYIQLLDGVYNSGQPYYGTENLATIDKGDGEVVDGYYNIVYQPTYDADGEVNGILNISMDVTAQVEARKAVEASEAQFTTLADNIQNLAWMADGEGAIYWYNKRWYEYTGTKPSEMEGWGWQKVHHPEELPKVLAGWGKAIESGDPFDMTFPIKGADGVFRQFLTRAYPIKDDDGKVLRWIGTNTDIHDQKEFSDELEKAVLERTTDLEKVNQSLQQANEQLNSFNYISSHDLQEPLRKIRTFSKLIAKSDSDRLSSDGADYLKRMEETVGRMQMLLDDLLEYSRARTGDKKFELSNLTKLAEEIKEEFNEMLEEKQAELTIEELGESKVIKFQFRQLLQNLIGNSLKFARNDVSPVIRISSRIINSTEFPDLPLERSKKYLQITFADNGIGFEPIYKDKIFDIFQRLHDKEKYKGTGIGLAIVKRIVENHNGYINAEGKIGEGSKFYLYLPI